MSPLVADRFVPAGNAWIDLATGAPVRMRFLPAPSTVDQFAWSERCTTLASLRHPLMNVLVDFGVRDRHSLFEAYAHRPPLAASGASGSRFLIHAARFLESHAVPLTTDLAPLVFREIAAGRTESRSRPTGITLRPRRILSALKEVLAEASPGGAVAIDVHGAPGSGLRTIKTLAARAARLDGYIPVSGVVLARLPWLPGLLHDRHVCLLVDDPGDRRQRDVVAAFLAQLGIASARRHVLLRFRRQHAPRSLGPLDSEHASHVPGSSRSARQRGVLENCDLARRSLARSGGLDMDPLGVTAMATMVYVDRDLGPSGEALWDAARRADGWPGNFLTQLGAAGLEGEPRLWMVHETPSTYTLEAAAAGVRRPKLPGAGRPRLDVALERAARLADRGRHAAAIRLLTRAGRVLEGRGDAQAAAACFETLGWILRARGRSRAALDAFTRASGSSREHARHIDIAVGMAVVWTDETRFTEAEAALRSAHVAADVAQSDGGGDDVGGRARRALARCLYWQRRFDETREVLEPLLVTCRRPSEFSIGVWELATRLRIAHDDLPGARAAAAEAVQQASRLGNARATATAERAVATMYARLGDEDAARRHVERGLAFATAAHLPLLSLRLRSILLRATPADRPTRARLVAHLRSALARRPLPALLRRDLENACGLADGPAVDARTIADQALTDLPRMLELAHSASDDRTATDGLCQVLCERLRAATVQIMTGSPDYRVLARAGRPWHGELNGVDCAMAGGSWPAAVREPRQTFELVRYGGEPLAALLCRWTPGVAVDPVRSRAMLRAGALAAAPGVRGLLDSRHELGSGHPAWSDLLGTSPATIALRDAVTRAARAPFPVLVEGESGSGKELVARAIHRLGVRRDRRFCAVNCAALSDELLEAELFGHTRGSFTGAVSDRAGLFEEADGGTLFLDEIGELSARAQAKLLRVLQDGEVRRVGENMPRRVDARIVAATNRRLGDEVQAGRFRADLRFRLDVVRIAVPPLRDRATDVPVLAMHFWQDAAARVASHATLAPDTLAVLARYDWPGNVRELQNVIATIAVHAPRRGRIGPAQLPAHVARSAVALPTTFDAAREEFERRFVRAALAREGGHRARVARHLGVSRQGLSKMIKRLRIDA